MWQIELCHFIKTEASFVSPSARMQWRRLCCEASMFVFINHAAKTADYTQQSMWRPGWIKKRRRWGKWNEKLRFPPANRYPWNAHGANDGRDFICPGSQLHFWAAVNQVCPCLRWRLPIGKRSGWNIGIAPAGREDACFSMFALVTTAPINAALTNLPRSGNHISEGLKGVFSTLPSQWPTSASYLPPFTALVIHSVFTHWPGDVVYLPAAIHQSQSSLIECAACTSCMSVMWQRVRCFVMLAWWKYSPPLSIHFNFMHL